MKAQSIILSVCVIALFSGNGAFAKKIHTFHYHYDPLADPCGGVICNSDQFCNTEVPERPVCKNKFNLGEDCAAEGQCNTTNSECLGDPTPNKCQCIPQFVEIQAACVPSCQDDSNGCQMDYYCHGTLAGCVPKVNLNSNCDETGGPSQCKTENAECLKTGENATCTCSTDFVEKNGACIPKCSDSSCSATEFCEGSGLCKPKKSLGQTCTDSKECLPQNSACNEDICACESDAYIPIFGSCLVDCKKDPAACDATTEYCSSKSSVCTRKANLHEGCTEATSEEVSSCSTEDAVCTPGSNPESSTCECGPNFTESDSICIAVCTVDQDCTEDNNFCNTDNGQCETKRELGQSCSATIKCSDDFQCPASGNQVCSCKDGFVESTVGGVRTCIAKCKVNADCSGDGQFCSTTSGLCTPQLGLNGLCKLSDVNEETNPCGTPFATCQGDDTEAYCLCDSEYVANGASCIAKCKVNTDCASNQTFCHTPSGVCESKVPSLGGTCFPPADGTEQCLIANSDCTPEGNGQTCQCVSGFKPRDGRCDITCTESAQCSANEYCDHANSEFCMTKVGLNEPCTYEDQCSKSDSVCTGEEDNKQCKCKTDYVDVSGACRPDCRALSNCSPLQFCNQGDGQCRNKAGLNGRCEEDEQCLYSEESTVCLSNSCRCKTDDYYEEASMCFLKCTKTTGCNFTEQFCNSLSFKCDPKADLHGMCTEEGEEQCTALATCEPETTGKLKCNCLDVAVASIDNKKCLRLASLIGDECKEPQQCVAITDGTCVTETQECGCNEDSTGSSSGKRCLKLATAIGDTCEEPQQCSGPALVGNPGELITNTTQCATGVCDCSSTAIKSDGKCYLEKYIGYSCVEDKECSVAITDGKCNTESKECGCNEDSTGSSSGKKCLKLATAIGDTCEEPQQCSGPALVGNPGELITNTTQCATGVCDCSSTAIKSDGKCYLEKYIGYSCVEDKECSVAITDGKCNTESKECGCNEDSTGSSSGKKCLKLATAIGDTCEEPQQCSGPGLVGNPGELITNTTQCATGVCDCSSTAIKSDGKCYLEKYIGYSCVEDKECSVTITDGKCNTESKECDCNADSTGSSSGKKCLKLATAIGDTCEEPQQCSVPALIGNPGEVTNTTDCAGRTCDCSTGALKSDGKCYINKSLGYSCVEDKECSVAITGGKCNPTSKECDCNTDSTGSSSGKKCLKLATAIGDPCEEPQQCSVPALIGNDGVTDTTQCAASKCDCAESSLKEGGKCYLNKALGDVCTRDVECSVSITGGKCDTTSNQCVCSEGTEGSVGSKECAKPNGGVTINAKFNPVWILLALIASFCFLP